MEGKQLLEYEELKDALEKLSNIMETSILELQTPAKYVSSVKVLFREFHNLKALSHHLKFKSVFLTAKTVEEILSILRQKEPPIKYEIVDWLLQINDHIREWSEAAAADKYDFEPIDSYTLEMIKASVIVGRTPKDIMSNLKLIYLDDDRARSAELTCIAMETLPNLSMACNWEMAKALLDRGLGDILIINAKINDANIENEIVQAIDEYNMPILVVSSTTISTSVKEKFQKLGVEYFLNHFLGEDVLFHRLVNMAKAYFEEKSIKITNNIFIKRVTELSPLSDTATKVAKLKANPDSSLKDISDVVSKDPIVSAKILKIANSPFSGLRGDISSIHHAVSLMGKEQISAMAMQTEMEKNVHVNLAPYMMNERDFYTISCMRMNLASYWYPKISVAQTGHVATAALLASLGQILIAEEVERSGLGSKFRQLIQSTSTPVFAEMELFGTTCEETTANILTNWGLDDTLVNLLRHANDIANASDELKQETIALYVILNTIPSIPIGLDDDKIADMGAFLKEMNFNPNHYFKAVEKVRNENKV